MASQFRITNHIWWSSLSLHLLRHSSRMCHDSHSPNPSPTTMNVFQIIYLLSENNMMICISVDIKNVECIKGGVHGDSSIDEFCSGVCRHEMNSTKNCIKVNRWITARFQHTSTTELTRMFHFDAEMKRREKHGLLRSHVSLRYLDLSWQEHSRIVQDHLATMILPEYVRDAYHTHH